jgi:hypothetical protein
MGEPALRLIVHELVTVIKANMTIDWIHRAPAREKIRIHVKRLLKKYGYPPDLQDSAVQNVPASGGGAFCRVGVASDLRCDRGQSMLQKLP